MASLEKNDRDLFISWEKVRRWPELGAVAAFLFLFVLFSLIAPRFFSFQNLAGVLTLVSELGIMTIGAAFLMICGEFDLSISSVYAMSGFIFVIISNSLTFSFGSIIALLVAFLFALTVGFINGVITLKGRIPSFIATLGMMMFLRGLLLGITGGTSVTYRGDSLAPRILTQFIAYRFRPSHLWFLGMILLFAFILNKTAYGNRVYATGGNKEVALMMGVNVPYIKISSFMIASLLASLSGVIAISRFRMANAAFGTGIELEAIAAAVIGGTFMTGGYGSVIGAAFGAAIMGMVRSGLVMSGAPSYWYNAFVGAILVIAALVNLKLSGFK